MSCCVGFGGIFTFGLFLIFHVLLFCMPGLLCLQLETQADFVSTTVHVLSINQTGEGELHSCTGRRVTTEL